MVKAPLSALEGISKAAAESLRHVGLKTVKDLGQWTYFHRAKAINTLAQAENGRRLKASTLNIDKALMTTHHEAKLKDLVGAPITAMRGITKSYAEHLKAIGVSTIGDLATSRHALRAEAMLTLQRTEATWERP